MKFLNKYIFVCLLSILALASCSDDDKYVAGEQDSAEKVGAYFPTTDGGNNEVDPSDPTEFSVKVARLNTKGAVSVPLTVKENDNDAYQVPATADFKDGEAETTVKIAFPNAAEGATNVLTIEVANDYVSLYKENAEKVSYTTTYTRVKWEDVGVGYWIDGNINTLFGIDAIPLAVDLQKTVSTDGKTIRYRFDSPFAYTVSGQDELGGYIGFPYNEEGDCDGQSHKMIVKVSGTTATLAPTYIGMNWADYGKFSIGQIVGNLKNANGIIPDTDTYPLGIYKKGENTPGTITWPANSLFIKLSEYNGGYVGVASNPSMLFLSSDDFKTYLDSQKEGE